MSESMIQVYAPASIGNFCVGFDSLGAAIEPIDGQLLGDVVRIQQSSQDSFRCVGHYADKLPDNPADNLAFQCLEFFREQIAPELGCVDLELEKNLPIGSGLGSSACSVVAALEAVHRYAVSQGMPALNQQQLIELMADFEAKVSGGRHYDNISPCYLGGLQLSSGLIPGKSVTISGMEEIYLVIAFPGFTLNTAKARSVLPQHTSQSDAIEFAQRMAAFVAFSCQGAVQSAVEVMKDIMAEPYRKSLISGFEEAQLSLPELGAKLVSISGAGPTLFSLCTDIESAEKCQRWLDNHYINEQGFSHICRLDPKGCRQLPLDSNVGI